MLTQLCICYGLGTCFSPYWGHHRYVVHNERYTVYVSAIYFILKQGYMFRLEVSHLQDPKTFSLPDALPTFESHSVYSCGIHLVKSF